MEQIVKKEIHQKTEFEINRAEAGWIVINGEKHPVNGRIAGIILDLLQEIDQLQETIRYMNIGHGEA